MKINDKCICTNNYHHPDCVSEECIHGGDEKYAMMIEKGFDYFGISTELFQLGFHCTNCGTAVQGKLLNMLLIKKCPSCNKTLIKGGY
jgi:hypothetical protein